MKPIISVKNACKSYGKQIVLDQVSVDFAPGRIHGLVGRNGSGKTVLFKAILGFIHLDQGEIIVQGQHIGQDTDFPESVGMMIERPGFLPHQSARQNLKLLAGIRNIIGDEEIDSAIKKVGLDPDDRKAVGKYSLGMRQRLGIAQAFMEDPDILILDEPLSGLDEKGVAEMHELFLELRNAGKTILIATHSKEDIAMLCDTVHRMEQGSIAVEKRQDH